MKILLAPVYKRPLDPTTPFARDVFGREAIARNLTHLFKLSSDGLVISIDAKWGEGKTSFIKFWELSLSRDTQFIPVYYDAFQHDFAGDAFVSIAAALQSALGNYSKSSARRAATTAQLSHLKKASKELAIDLAKMTSGLAVASLSGGLITSAPLLEWVKKAFERIAFGTLKVNANEQFEAYLRSQDSIREFQSKLRDILSAPEPAQQKKVVVFLDELDRCRPAFAVEILEKIKHLFNVPGVFFVLAMNRDQLMRTIAAVYGLDPRDSAIYLQKFVDIETRLPSITSGPPDRSEDQVRAHLLDLAQELNLLEGPVSIASEIDALTFLLSQRIRLNPRSIERVMSFIALAVASCEEADAVRLKKHIAVAAAVRVGSPAQYEALLRDGAVSDSRADGVHIFDWARKYFEHEKEDRAANVFLVPALREASRILDMYEIPGRLLEQTTSGETPNPAARADS